MNNAQLHGCTFEGWQCFHCGEVFTTVGGAEDHFGAAKGTTPGCLLKVQLGSERGWLMEYRKQEKRIAELEQERKDAEARFQAALQYSGEVNTKNQRLRDALSYAMDYMDSEQQRDFKTELWPELFTGDEA